MRRKHKCDTCPQGFLTHSNLVFFLCESLQYYIGPEGRGTVDEISTKMREGCHSYFNESDYKYYLAVECLERASMTNNHDEKDILARDAFNLLTKIPDSADLSAICKRFENLRLLAHYLPNYFL
jgi:hypothetical protein